MDDTMLEQHLANIDRGLARVEQILPALATKDEVRNLDRRLTNVEQILLQGIEPRLVMLEQILPTLATKMELAQLRREIHEEAKQSRHYMKILDEAHRGDIQLLAEHLVQAMRNPPKE